MTGNKKYSSVGVALDTLDKLTYLSEVSGLPKIKLLQLCIDELYNIGANFERLTLDFDSLVSQNKIFIYCSGKPKLTLRKEGAEND